jgi:hypothetical protein
MQPPTSIYRKEDIGLLKEPNKSTGRLQGSNIERSTL